MKKTIIIFFAIVSWVVTAGIAFSYIFSSNISFWYDPARDLLEAWAATYKFTLIGPTSGIPGIFYGPYWIWWLSIILHFSKNPAIVTGIAITIPYIFGFAGLLWLFHKLFGKTVVIMLWLLFFFSSVGDMTQIWNPYLAPIFFLGTIYILVFFMQKTPSFKNTLPIIFAGILTGLALNVHISFSIGFLVGCLLFLILESLSKEKMSKQIRQIFFFLACFGTGVFFTFLPFLLFEVRHGFNQTKTALYAFSQGGGVVGLQGLSKQDILLSYFGKLSDVLKTPPMVGVILTLAIIITLTFFAIKNKFTHQEKKLYLLLMLISFSVLSIYLLAKNPIWPYHFIGTEIILLLFIGLCSVKFSFIKYLLFLWVIYVGIQFSANLLYEYHQNPLTRGDLYTKEFIVTTIQKDAKGSDYAVFSYSPSIYTYEYDYLFRWMTGKEFSYDPGQIRHKRITYLILPVASSAKLEDFIHFTTPDNSYKTNKIWHIPDGTMVIKRIHI